MSCSYHERLWSAGVWRWDILDGYTLTLQHSVRTSTLWQHVWVPICMALEIVWSDDVRNMSVQFGIAIKKDLIPIVWLYWGDNSSSEVTRLPKEAISPIQKMWPFCAVLYGVVGLQWSERPMIINNEFWQSRNPVGHNELR